MDTTIPVTFEGATRRLRVLQRKGVQIGLNQVIENTIVDYTQSICDDSGVCPGVTVHYTEVGLNVTADKTNSLLTTIKAPEPEHSFQLSFRNKAPQLLRYLEEQTQAALLNHQIH